MSEDKVNVFSIHLIRPDHELGSAPAEDSLCVKLKPSDQEQNIEIDGEFIGRLFVRKPFHTPPKWTRLFEKSVDTRIFGTGGASSAVLICEAGGREYAITFGQGRYLLNPSAIEEQFGLRTALNILDVKGLRGLDKRSFDTISKQAREQASREVDVKAFGFDIEQDLLRSVTGVPREPKFGIRVNGMDALKTSVRAGLADIKSLLERYNTAYQANDYKENFSWIDQFAEVRNNSERNDLDEALVATIAAQNLDRCWLAAPDIIDWAQVAHFTYQQVGDKSTYHDIGWESFLPKLQGQNLSLEALKSKHVACVDGNDQLVGRWSVYKCIYGEIERNNITYLLSNGRWYRLNTDFAKQVNEYYSQIPRSTLVLPAYAQKGEGDYNIFAAKANTGSCAHMDQKLIDRVEFCDLYFKNRVLVHVKRYGASSSLSHLFAQGLVSGQLFASDERFRRQLNEVLPEPYRLADHSAKVVTGDYEIVFAIISDQVGDELTLPFFSRLNLRHAVRTLQGYGYRVSLLKIPVKR